MTQRQRDRQRNSDKTTWLIWTRKRRNSTELITAVHDLIIIIIIAFLSATAVVEKMGMYVFIISTLHTLGLSLSTDE